MPTSAVSPHLLQLASPSLPVGAYAYSQGLEAACERDLVPGESGAADWILGLLVHAQQRIDVPLLARFYEAHARRDEERADHLSAWLHAMRESRELQDEDRRIGAALARLLRDLDVPGAARFTTHRHASYAGVFALAAAHWRIPLADTATAYVWAWLDSQVAAAIKLVPLGQTAGQRILVRAATLVPEVVERALGYDDDEVGAATPGLAMLSALHETQYSRLFRS